MASSGNGYWPSLVDSNNYHVLIIVIVIISVMVIITIIFR